MAVKECDVVLISRKDGEQSLNYPITRLKNIDAAAEEKTAPAPGDYIPLLDGADGAQMKKVAWEQVKAALGGGSADVYELTFTESDWTAGEGGYTLTIPRSAHGMEDGAFGFRLWHTVDGVPTSGTWAAAGTQAAYQSGDGSIVLTAGDAYAGKVQLYSL